MTRGNKEFRMHMIYEKDIYIYKNIVITTLLMLNL